VEEPVCPGLCEHKLSKVVNIMPAMPVPPSSLVEVTPNMVDTSSLPAAVVEALQSFSEGPAGDGLSVQDIMLAADKWKASQGMHDGFPLKAFPEDLQGTMKAFDQDGDGTVNKAELAAAARMYQESKHKVRALGKVILAMSVVLVFTLFAIMGLTYVVVESSKETNTGSDGTMTVKGSSETVRVDVVESSATIWDIPAVDTDDLANMKSITVHIDMRHMPTVGGIAEATFKVAGAYKVVGTDKAFVTTNDGYTITIDGFASKGTIDMGTKGIFAISADNVADDEQEGGRRLVVPGWALKAAGKMQARYAKKGSPIPNSCWPEFRQCAQAASPTASGNAAGVVVASGNAGVSGKAAPSQRECRSRYRRCAEGR